ncbi:hypothetical protein D3C84_1133270 [compost metagenome]
MPITFAEKAGIKLLLGVCHRSELFLGINICQLGLPLGLRIAQQLGAGLALIQIQLQTGEIVRA